MFSTAATEKYTGHIIVAEEHLGAGPGQKCFGCRQTLGMNTLVSGTDYRQRSHLCRIELRPDGARREGLEWEFAERGSGPELTDD